MNDETKTEATEPGTDMAISDGHSRNIAQTDPLGSVGALLDAMMKLARDPEVDAQKFETIARVAKDARDDAKKEQYYQDKAAAMFAMPVIRKDKRIVIPIFIYKEATIAQDDGIEARQSRRRNRR